jgi:hypothetical protein
MRQEEIDIIKGYAPDPCEAHADQEAETVERPVVPPEGYRLLVEGEPIRKGDIYCRGNVLWVENESDGGKWHPGAIWPMARKIGG